MKEKGNIAKVLAYGVKIAGPKTWLFSLVKENLGPKIGTGIAVYNVAKIILDSLEKSSNPNSAVTSSAADVVLQQAESLFSMLKLMNSWPLTIALIASSSLWFLALLARGCFKFWKAESVGLFKFGQFGPYFGVAAQFFIGMLLVPLVLAGAIVTLVPGAFTLEQGAQFWVIAIAFLALVITMHYFAFIEKELTNSVVYTLATPNTMTAPVSPKVAEEFSAALDGLRWVGEAEPFSESGDGRLVLTIPILYNADHWSSSEANQLGKRLHTAESALIGKGCEVLSRVIPKKIQGDLSLEWKKPFELPKKGKAKK